MAFSAAEQNPIEVADWAEKELLCTDTLSVSFEQVRTRLEVEGTLAEEGYKNDASERLAGEVFAELSRRANRLGKVYPFSLDSDLIYRDEAELKPYDVLLLLADRDLATEASTFVFDSVHFEHLAEQAVRSFFGCETYRFGAPRDDKTGIKDALIKLAKLTKAKFGGNFPVNDTDKDLGLDIVGWKPFPDAHPGHVAVYMQCATQDNWQHKLGDPDIHGLWSRILDWPVTPVPAIAVPFVVREPGLWERARRAILWDRLRLCFALAATEIDDEMNMWGRERVRLYRRVFSSE